MTISRPDGTFLFQAMSELESQISLLDKPKGITKELNKTVVQLKMYIEDLTMTLTDLEMYAYRLETKIELLESKVEDELEKLK